MARNEKTIAERMQRLVSHISVLFPVCAQHLFIFAALFRIENLHDAAVAIRQNVVVIAENVVQNGRELNGLLIGEIELFLPFADRERGSDARDQGECPVEIGADC